MRCVDAPGGSAPSKPRRINFSPRLPITSDDCLRDSRALPGSALNTMISAHDLTWWSPLRLALSLAVASGAARLALGWALSSGAAGRLQRQRWAPAFAAGLSLGAGVWLLRALVALFESLSLAPQPPAGLSVGLLPAALAIALVVLAVLAAGQLRWRAPPLQARGLWIAALLLALTLVSAQEWVGLLLAPAQASPATASGWSLRWEALGAAVLASLMLMALWALQVRHARAAADRLQVLRRQSAQALNDPLTGLPGRMLFEGTLAQAVGRADAKGERLVLLHVGIDDFSQINESLGHAQGDRVLRKVASRLRALVRPHMAARLGGDEFLLLLAEHSTIDDAATLAAELRLAVSMPCELAERQIVLSCSIGMVMYPEHGTKATLIGHAAAAMRAAKSAGGDTYAFFNTSMGRGARDQNELLRDMRTAITSRELELYYQPKVHAPSGEITGVEALLRWHHPRRGMVSPEVFLPLAERYGLINALGAWVIDEACRQARAWRDSGLRMRVAINLSAVQLRQESLSEQLRSALQRHGINPELITCEITETTAMEDTEATARVLAQLHEVGVGISIDDFGTGQSSLAYLRKLSADELKIDRSFVLDLEASEDACKVASAVVQLAKALGIKVVAEGVETEGQYQLLRSFGCDVLQGYLFAKPMTAVALAKWAIEDEGPRTMNFRASLFAATRQLMPG